MSRGLSLLEAATVTLFWFFFILADFDWEKKKQRGLDVQARPGRLGMRSERAEYEAYSWIRYLAAILLTYLNTIDVFNYERQDNDTIVSPIRMFWAFSVLILFSIGLLAIDGFWDRMRRRRLTRVYEMAFWSYFWLRYPALFLATMTATKRGLQP